MSTENVNKNFITILNRLKLALEEDMEKDVAARLGMSKEAFASRKKRGAVPEKEIQILCTQNYGFP
jgi:hypothetical protein